MSIFKEVHWVTSLFDLTFAEPIHYVLKPESEIISLSESFSPKVWSGSTYLDRSLVKLWSK